MKFTAMSDKVMNILVKYQYLIILLCYIILYYIQSVIIMRYENPN
jgi:hypothetical protein